MKACIRLVVLCLWVLGGLQCAVAESPRLQVRTWNAGAFAMPGAVPALRGAWQQPMFSNGAQPLWTVPWVGGTASWTLLDHAGGLVHSGTGESFAYSFADSGEYQLQLSAESGTGQGLMAAQRFVWLPRAISNLIVNPGAEDSLTGWNQTLNGGDGWLARTWYPRTGGYCFGTSFGMDVQSQEIDLIAAGYDSAELDAGTLPITTGLALRAREFDGKYFIRAELRDQSGGVLDSWTLGSQVSPLILSPAQGWVYEYREFTGYPAGVRSVFLEYGGQDTKGWGGHFGTHFDDAAIMVGDRSELVLLPGLVEDTEDAIGPLTISYIPNFPDNTTLMVELLRDGSRGSVSIDAGSSQVLYSSQADAWGADSFELRFRDDQGVWVDKLVEVQIAPVPDAPEVMIQGETLEWIPGQSMALDALQSEDADGDSMEFSWRAISPTGAEDTGSGDSLNLVPDQAGTWTLVVDALDATGLTSSLTLEVPARWATVPDSGEQQVSLAVDSLEIMLGSVPIDPASVTDQSLQVRDALSGATLPGTTHWDSAENLLRFVPDSGFALGRDMQVIADTSARTLGGEPLFGVGQSWQFSMSDSVETVEAVYNALRYQWLEAAARRVHQAYGLMADSAEIGINVYANAEYGTIMNAAMMIDGGGNVTQTILHVDALDVAGLLPSGSGNHLDPMHADRIVAHELTHAIMAQHMNWLVNDAIAPTGSQIPTWFKQGTAELIHGRNYYLKQDIDANGGTGAGSTAIITNWADGWHQTNEDYSGAYAAVRYLHENSDGIKAIMQDLAAGSDLDTAIANNSSYTDTADFNADFSANGAVWLDGIYASLDDDADVGAIGGRDVDAGPILTAETVLDESVNQDFDGQPLSAWGWTVLWPADEQVAGANPSFDP